MANQYDTNLKLQAIADAIGDTQSSGLISALEDIADAVAGGGGGSSAGLVSDNFSETDTYDLGDYCIHNNTLYVCINAITTPGPWDLSDWQSTNAGLELTSLNSALTNVFNAELLGQTTSTTDVNISGDNTKYKAFFVGLSVGTHYNDTTIASGFYPRSIFTTMPSIQTRTVAGNPLALYTAVATYVDSTSIKLRTNATGLCAFIYGIN